MAIMRFQKGKKNPYFMVHNSTISDNRLSNKAKGLLCYIFSKPDNWYVSYNDLIKSSTDGIKSIRSTIKELISAGYLKRTQFRNDNGQYGYYDLTIFEKPQIPKYHKNKLTPYTPKRHAVQPHAETSPILITNKKNNTYKNNNNTVVNLNSNGLSVDVPNSSKPKKETSGLLNELKIKNHNKLFDMFTISDIFNYAYWIKERNFKMENPTGFLITAIREKWMDQESIDNTKGLRVFFAECTACGEFFAYEEYEPKYTECINCRKKKEF
ncbi:hypothetical protein ES705_15247 [subsurface metagenome]